MTDHELLRDGRSAGRLRDLAACCEHALRRIGGRLRRPERRSSAGFAESYDTPSVLGHPFDAQESGFVLVLGALPWLFRRQRPQQLSLAIARSGARVLYVDAFAKGRLQEKWRVRGEWAGVLVAELALAGRPDPFRAVLARSAAAEIADEISSRLRRAPAWIIAQLPFWGRVGARLRRQHGGVLVYDRMDRHTAFWDVPAGLQTLEEELIAEADVVAASSEELLSDLDGAAAVCLVRNGVWLEDFPLRKPTVMKRPTAGLVGSLNERIDWEAIRVAAESLPDWRFSLAGSIEGLRSGSRPLLPQNVELCGEIPYSRVAAHLSNLTVGLLPFEESALTRSVDAVKLYEMLAVGLPVAARRLPGTAAYDSPLVYGYDSPEELAATMMRAGAENDPAIERQRRDLVRGQVWTARAEQLRQGILRLKNG